MPKKNAAPPKRGASRYQPPAPRKPLPGWAWLVCGLVIGAFVTFLVTLKPGGEEIRRVEESSRTSREPVRTPPDNAPPKPKYDFYTLLPESEVIVPPTEEAPAAKPPIPIPAEPPAKPVNAEEAARIETARAEAALRGEVPPPAPPAAAAPARGTQFFLQAGSFRKPDDADKVRAQILLLGHGVQVESGNVRGETWYRVLVGPYPDQQRLGQAQKQLAASGYGNLLPQKRQVR